MYWPPPGRKIDPEQRWAQGDRAFFGFGACHILAGVFLTEAPLEGFHGDWITPSDGFSGTHVYVTDGQIAFDYHGYCNRARLLDHYWRGYRARYPSWDARIERVAFSLLDTEALNARGHRGPDQYFGDPVARAKRFIGLKRLPYSA